MYKENKYSPHDIASAIKYSTILDELNEGIAILNSELKYLYVNNSYAKQLQLASENIIGKTISDLGLESESNIDFNKACQNVLQNRITQQIETNYMSEHWYQVHFSLVPEGILIQSHEVTENKLDKKRMHELSELSENRLSELKAVIESFPDGLLIGNHDGIIQSNARALSLLGFDSLDDFKGGIDVIPKKINARHPDSGIRFTFEENLLVRALKGETAEEDILFTNYKTGIDAIIRCASAPVIRDGKIIYAVIVETDITEIKEEELKTKSSLKEKEILLRELYHRTKNNLTVISSLLSLKAQALEDMEMISILNDMNNRIRTIGEIHDMLHKSNSYERVNLNNYIVQIVNRLINSFSDRTDRILLKTELEDIFVHVDTAISCGLVVNELITNSFKYAFPENTNGEINIKLLKQSDIIELNVLDNGVGFNEEELSEDHLGLKIFRLIAEGQLNAKTEVKVNKGVSVSMRFKDDRNSYIPSGKRYA